MTNQPHGNVEIKARVADLGAALTAARALPAREAGLLRQVDTYFRTPRGRLKLRVTDGAGAELIYYERPDQGAAKRSDYWIAPVLEPAVLEALLTAALGVHVRIAKTRRLLLYRHTRIHLDAVAGLGTFVELETVLDGLSEEEGRAESAEVANALGLAPEALLDGSYADMVVLPDGVPIF